MKKLLLLCLVLLGGVMQVSAADYWVGGNFNSADDNWTTKQMSENGDGTYSLFVNLNEKSLYFNIFTGSDMEWGTNSYRPVSNGPWINNSVPVIDVLYPGDTGYNDSYGSICYPTIAGGDNWNVASAIRIDFNPTTKKVSVSRFISVPNGYNGWSTTTDYIPETTFGSKIYSGNVTLQADTDGQADGFKFYYIDTSAAYGGKKIADNGDWIAADGGSNYDVAQDGVYTLTADFSTWKWQDPVLVKKTASVTALGIGTFCSEYALDFTGITDINAYIIDGEKDGQLNTKQVTGKVKAGTGLFIERGDGTAAEASADIPTTIYTEEPGTNWLKGVTTDTPISQTDGANTNYILTTNGGATARFYKVNGTSGNNVGAGKAYLQVPGTPANEFFWFADENKEEEEVTGINAVAKTIDSNAAMFNLSGQRVNNDYKGVVIQNGKKFIVK